MVHKKENSLLDEELSFPISADKFRRCLLMKEKRQRLRRSVESFSQKYVNISRRNYRIDGL